MFADSVNISSFRFALTMYSIHTPFILYPPLDHTLLQYRVHIQGYYSSIGFIYRDTNLVQGSYTGILLQYRVHIQGYYPSIGFIYRDTTLVQGSYTGILLQYRVHIQGYYPSIGFIYRDIILVQGSYTWILLLYRVHIQGYYSCIGFIYTIQGYYSGIKFTKGSIFQIFQLNFNLIYCVDHLGEFQPFVFAGSSLQTLFVET